MIASVSAHCWSITLLVHRTVVGAKLVLPTAMDAGSSRSVLLNQPCYGPDLLAIGGNEEAARLAGLPVTRSLLTIHALSGGLAGLTGAMLAAQTFTGNPNGAVGWDLSAIAAVTVGGTLLTGGGGSVWTTLVGVLLHGLINNALGFENLEPYRQNVTHGGFL